MLISNVMQHNKSAVSVCFISMDIDGTMMVDWNEWREHFLLHPAQNLEEIIRYWKHSSVWDTHTLPHTFCRQIQMQLQLDKSRVV